MNPKKPGDRLDPRRLESIEGQGVDIPHANRLTHLQFRRFVGCPICNLHLQSFLQRHRELNDHGIQEVAVFHSSQKAMLVYHPQSPFPFIADPTKALYKEFGVETSVLSVLNPKAWSAAIKGVIHHGAGLPALGESPLGLPADFLIDSDGKIVAAKYGEYADDQWDVDEVLTLASAYKE